MVHSASSLSFRNHDSQLAYHRFKDVSFCRNVYIIAGGNPHLGFVIPAALILIIGF
jgi:hypothetical protein